MPRTKHLLQALSIAVIIALAIPLLSPSHSIYPTAHASAKTISLVANSVGSYYYWNSTNPTITVTQGDSITIDLSSSGVTHRFLLDFDNDGLDTSDCSSAGDPCSSAFSSSATVPTFTTNTVGTFHYYCTIHYPYMMGQFIVQAAPTPNFSISSNPSTLNIAQGAMGTTTITLMSVNGFSGTVTLAGSVSPSGPSVSFSPATLTVSGASATSTLTVSAASMGLYSTPVSNGNYSVNVTATSGSLSHSTTVQVTVGSSSSPAAGALNLPATVWIGVAVVIIAAIALTVYLVRRKADK